MSNWALVVIDLRNIRSTSTGRTSQAERWFARNSILSKYRAMQASDKLKQAHHFPLNQYYIKSMEFYL